MNPWIMQAAAVNTEMVCCVFLSAGAKLQEGTLYSHLLCGGRNAAPLLFAHFQSISCVAGKFGVASNFSLDAHIPVTIGNHLQAFCTDIAAEYCCQDSDSMRSCGSALCRPASSIVCCGGHQLRQFVDGVLSHNEQHSSILLMMQSNLALASS